MALGYRCSATDTSTNTGGSSTLDITIPTSGTGGTTVAGDVGIACLEWAGSQTVTGTPSGWTQRKLTLNAQLNITGAIYTKTLVAGDINTTTTWTLSAGTVNTGSIDVVSGADESSFVYVAWTVGTGTTVTSPTLTVPVNGWLMGFWMGGLSSSGAAFTFTKNGTYTALSTAATSITSGLNHTQGTAYISVPAGGSTAGVGCTFSASTARNAVYSIGIAPIGDQAIPATDTDTLTDTSAYTAATPTTDTVTLTDTSANATATPTTDTVALTDTAGLVATLSEVLTLTNAFPNPDCESGGTAFGTSNTTVVLGSTDWSVSGAGSAKITVGGSPTTNTYGYPATTTPDTDPASNGHTRFTAAAGDTFDFLFTVRSDPGNSAINILPKIVDYFWNGSAAVASGSGAANGTAVPLNPGDVVAVAQRITVLTPPTDPVDGILAIPHIRASNVANAPPAGTVIYLDRMMLVRNASRPLTTDDYLDGNTLGASWVGSVGASSSTGQTGRIDFADFTDTAVKEARTTDTDTLTDTSAYTAATPTTDAVALTDTSANATATPTTDSVAVTDISSTSAIVGSSTIVNAIPNPTFATGGTAPTANLTTATLGSTEFDSDGDGFSLKVVVGGSPNTTSTYAYPTAGLPGDPATNTHSRYTAVVGDTYDWVFTVKAAAANAGVITVRPRLIGYFWNGTTETGSAGFPATFFTNNLSTTPINGFQLNPGDVVTFVGWTTVPSATDPVDGILVLPYIFGSSISVAATPGDTVYFDRMLLVRNAPRRITAADWFDGDSPGASWSGLATKSSSSGGLLPFDTVSFTDSAVKEAQSATSSTLTDTSATTYATPTTDAVTLTDAAVKTAMSADTVTATDTSATTYATPTTDTVTVTDSATKEAQSPDAVTLTDTSATTYATPTTDTVMLSESVDVAQTGTSPNVTDNYLLTDSSFITSVPTTTDTGTLTDASGVATTTATTDAVLLTDSSATAYSTVTTDSAALTEATGKTATTSDTNTLTDTSVTTYSTVTTDSVALTDTSATTYSTATTDAVLLTDTSLVTSAPATTDAATLTDFSSTTYATPTTDTATVTSPVPTTVAALPTTDAATLTDASGVATTTATTDAGTLTDVSARTITVNTTDTGTLSEAVTGRGVALTNTFTGTSTALLHVDTRVRVSTITDGPDSTIMTIQLPLAGDAGGSGSGGLLTDTGLLTGTGLETGESGSLTGLVDRDVVSVFVDVGGSVTPSATPPNWVRTDLTSGPHSTAMVYSHNVTAATDGGSNFTITTNGSFNWVMTLVVVRGTNGFLPTVSDATDSTGGSDVVRTTPTISYGNGPGLIIEHLMDVSSSSGATGWTTPSGYTELESSYGSAGGGTPLTRAANFGTLVTLTAHAAAEFAGGSTIGMLELNWASYETADGVYSASYITTIKAQMAALQAAGMQVTLAMGVHHPPAWALALANSKQIDQTGAVTGQIDTIFNKVIRAKVEAYYTKIDADLGIENFWAIRLTSGGNAEMLHPGGNSYWAFGPNAQNGANMPTTMDPNPFPGWHPGDTTTLNTTQVRQWATWYVNALVDVTDWQMQFFTGLGFTGYYQTLTPGSGRRPSVFTSDVNNFLPNSTTGVGAVWDVYYAGLRNRTNVVVYISSVADGSGSDDFSQPGDDALAITSTTMNSWSATRFQTRIAHEYSMLVGGENPGFTTGGAAHYSDTTSAGLMAKSMAQVTGCGLFVFYWAHDDRLWDGSSQAFVNYAAAIALINSTVTGTVANVFPNPDCVAGGTAFGTSNTTVTLGSTEYAAHGSGSAKITVGGSPTTSTFGYPAVASGDAVDNGHTRYTAAAGDTFDVLFTVKAHASNTASVNILPKVTGYHWNGTANVASTGGETNGIAVLLNPGDVAVVVQRITVATPPTDPIDGVLIIPHIRSGANVASPPVAGAVIYLDRMCAVRNSPRPLTTADWFDGATPGGSWTGSVNLSSSSESINGTGGNSVNSVTTVSNSDMVPSPAGGETYHLTGTDLEALASVLVYQSDPANLFIASPIDSGGLTDASSLQAAPARFDQFFVVDTSGVAVATSTTDVVGLLDRSALVASWPLTDALTVTDTSGLTLQFTGTDTGTVTDTSATDYSTATTDTEAFTDTSVLTYLPATTDSVTVTDRSTSKASTTTDSATVTDSSGTTAAPSRTDAETLIDTAVLTYSPATTDTGTLTNTSVMTYLPATTDTGTLTDTSATSYTTPVTDTGTLTDTAAVGTSTATTDAALLTDTSVLTYSPATTDTATVTDTASTNYTTAAIDTGTLTDTSAIAPDVQGTDHGTLTDSSVLGFTALPTDTETLTDATTAMAKATTDAAAFTEASDRAQFGGETPNTVDDLTFTESVDKDQDTTDSGTFGDASATSYTTPTTDSVSFTDTSLVVNSPALTDAVTTTDTSALVAAVPVTDTTTLTDTAALTYSPTTVDAATVTDTSVTSYTTPVTDTAALTEGTAGVQVDAAATDAGLLTDTSLLTYSPASDDTATLTDTAAVDFTIPPLEDDLAVTDTSAVDYDIEATDDLTATDVGLVEYVPAGADDLTLDDESLLDIAPVSVDLGELDEDVDLQASADLTDDYTVTDVVDVGQSVDTTDTGSLTESATLGMQFVTASDSFTSTDNYIADLERVSSDVLNLIIEIAGAGQTILRADGTVLHEVAVALIPGGALTFLTRDGRRIPVASVFMWDGAVRHPVVLNYVR